MTNKCECLLSIAINLRFALFQKFKNCTRIKGVPEIGAKVHFKAQEPKSSSFINLLKKRQLSKGILMSLE